MSAEAGYDQPMWPLGSPAGQQQLGFGIGAGFYGGGAGAAMSGSSYLKRGDEGVLLGHTSLLGHQHGAAGHPASAMAMQQQYAQMSQHAYGAPHQQHSSMQHVQHNHGHGHGGHNNGGSSGHSNSNSFSGNQQRRTSGNSMNPSAAQFKPVSGNTNNSNHASGPGSTESSRGAGKGASRNTTLEAQPGADSSAGPDQLLQELTEVVDARKSSDEQLCRLSRQLVASISGQVEAEKGRAAEAERKAGALETSLREQQEKLTELETRNRELTRANDLQQKQVIRTAKEAREKETASAERMQHAESAVKQAETELANERDQGAQAVLELQEKLDGAVQHIQGLEGAFVGERQHLFDVIHHMEYQLQQMQMGPHAHQAWEGQMMQHMHMEPNRRLEEHQLLHMFLDLLGKGKECMLPDEHVHARNVTPHFEVEVDDQLKPLTWERDYQPQYGSIADFLCSYEHLFGRTNQDAFFRRVPTELAVAQGLLRDMRCPPGMTHPPMPGMPGAPPPFWIPPLQNMGPPGGMSPPGMPSGLAPQNWVPPQPPSFMQTPLPSGAMHMLPPAPMMSMLPPQPHPSATSPTQPSAPHGMTLHLLAPVGPVGTAPPSMNEAPPHLAPTSSGGMPPSTASTSPPSVAPVPVSVPGSRNAQGNGGKGAPPGFHTMPSPTTHTPPGFGSFSGSPTPTATPVPDQGHPTRPPAAGMSSASNPEAHNLKSGAPGAGRPPKNAATSGPPASNGVTRVGGEGGGTSSGLGRGSSGPAPGATGPSRGSSGGGSASDEPHMAGSKAFSSKRAGGGGGHSSSRGGGGGGGQHSNQAGQENVAKVVNGSSVQKAQVPGKGGQGQGGQGQGGQGQGAQGQGGQAQNQGAQGQGGQGHGQGQGHEGQGTRGAKGPWQEPAQEMKQQSGRQPKSKQSSGRA